MKNLGMDIKISYPMHILRDFKRRNRDPKYKIRSELLIFIFVLFINYQYLNPRNEAAPALIH